MKHMCSAFFGRILAFCNDLNYDNIDLLDNLSYSVITNSLSSSSSGSSSSGGCSSCGGGCSSCGGGGSW